MSNNRARTIMGIFKIVSVLAIVVFFVILNLPVYSTRKVNSELIYALNQKDESKFYSLISDKYKEKIEKSYFQQITDTIGNQECSKISINKSYDRVFGEEEFNGEKEKLLYTGTLECSKSNFYISIRINEENKIVELIIKPFHGKD